MQQLDHQFDAALIRQELEGREFVPHSLKEWQDTGNSALLLVTTDGEQNHDFDEPMLPTLDLEAMPYTKSIWKTLGVPYTRSRFMRVKPGGRNQMHKDTGDWWLTHQRIHIPVQTNDKALFVCGEEIQHLPEGTCWLVNTRDNQHSAINDGVDHRIHLVIDVEDTWLPKIYQ